MKLESQEKIIVSAKAIRDTNAVTSDTIKLQGMSKKSIAVVNGLNQNVSIQLKGSADNSTFINVGTAQTVNSGTNAIIGSNEVTALNNYFPYLQLTVTAALSPTTGNITVIACSCA